MAYVDWEKINSNKKKRKEIFEQLHGLMKSKNKDNSKEVLTKMTELRTEAKNLANENNTLYREGMANKKEDKKKGKILNTFKTGKAKLDSAASRVMNEITNKSQSSNDDNIILEDDKPADDIFISPDDFEINGVNISDEEDEELNF